jgi:hypothetical protein
MGDGRQNGRKVEEREKDERKKKANKRGKK